MIGMLSIRDWNTTIEQQIETNIKYTQLETKVSTENNDKTILIAGLTTGLVVICMIITTFGLFILLRRRKMIEQEEKSIIDFSIKPITPITPIHLPPEEFDPFIIGAQSLQIPHLEEPNNNRRSLEIQPTKYLNEPIIFERSSSVKITKYDNQPTRLKSIQPKLVRINTILKRDETGQTKKTCIKTTTTNDNSCGTIDFYLCPPPSNTSSNSSLGDGSITVFWKPPSSPYI